MSPSLSRRDLLLGTAAAGLAEGLPAQSFAQAQISRGASRPGKPNVIVIVIDTLRRDHIGIHGNDWIETPNLDALGRQSLRFSRAVPEAMPTIPARRSIHSGHRTFPFRNWERRSGNETSVWGWQHIPDDQPTLAEHMRGAGYATLLVSDAPHEFKPSMNFTRGFTSVQWIRGQEGDDYQPFWTIPGYNLERYMYRSAGGEELTSKSENLPLIRELRQYLANNAGRRSEEDYLAPRVFRSAAQVLENIPRDQPFFLVVDSFDPHEPWDVPRGYVDLYGDPDYDQPERVSPSYGSGDYLTEEQLERMRVLYAAEVTMVDRWLGFFLKQVDKSGLMESSLIMLVSDHGMALGEHGAVGKPSFALWPEMTDVPLFVCHPDGKGADQESGYFGSTHDIAPTVLDFAGIEQKKKMDGNSLLPILEGKTPELPREHFTSGLNNYVWVSDKRYAMIAKNDGTDAKLYDIQEDPSQTRDIAQENPDVVKRLFDLVLEDAGGEALPQYG